MRQKINNWNSDENLAGKYAEFLGINRNISFENEFRWPPFYADLQKEVVYVNNFIIVYSSKRLIEH
jgi:hypothetical protein